MATVRPATGCVRAASRAVEALRRSRVGDPTDAPTGVLRTARTTRHPGLPATRIGSHTRVVGVRLARSNHPIDPAVRVRRTATDRRGTVAAPRRTAARRRLVAARRTGDRPPPPRWSAAVPRWPPPYRDGPRRIVAIPPRDRGQSPDRPPWRPDRPGGPPAGRSWQPSGPGPTPWPRPGESLPAPDLLGPDEELVAGRRPVEEVFAAGRTALRLLVVPQRRNALEQLVLHATRLRIPIVEVEGGSLTAIAGFDGHQGVALVVEPRQFASLADILARAEERGEPPFVLVLDSLEDPQNVGTLLRSAEAAGVHGIVFPTRRQAPLSPAAVKASAGAVEHLLLCPVDDLPGALADLHAAGPARRRLGGGRAADRPPERPARTAGDRHRQRGPGSGTGGPQALRPVHADPDARRDRIAQRGRRRLDPAVRGRRPARPGQPARSQGGRRRGISRRPETDPGDRDGDRRARRRPAKARKATPKPTEGRRHEAAEDPKRTHRRRRPQRRPDRGARRRDLLPGGPEPARHTRAATSRRPPERATLDPSDRAALSFPGADGVICGMTLRVAPT